MFLEPTLPLLMLVVGSSGYSRCLINSSYRPKNCEVPFTPAHGVLTGDLVWSGSPGPHRRGRGLSLHSQYVARHRRGWSLDCDPEPGLCLCRWELLWGDVGLLLTVTYKSWKRALGGRGPFPSQPFQSGCLHILPSVLVYISCL